jgi:Golgi phosphoprotein 3 (GPP34)
MPAPQPLGNDFWLAAHDTVNGKSRLPARHLGIGVAAALLGELMFTQNITLHQGRLYIRDVPTPDDPALSPLLSQLIREESLKNPDAPPGQDVREWIAFLAADDRGNDLVVHRLAQQGLVVREERRGWTGRRTLYLPRDSMVSGTPANLISTAILRREELDDAQLTVAGLFLATGLHQQALFMFEPPDLKELSRQLKTRMHDMLRELVHHAETAVGETVMIR